MPYLEEASLIAANIMSGYVVKTAKIGTVARIPLPISKQILQNKEHLIKNKTVEVFQ